MSTFFHRATKINVLLDTNAIYKSRARVCGVFQKMLSHGFHHPLSPLSLFIFLYFFFQHNFE